MKRYLAAFKRNAGLAGILACLAFAPTMLKAEIAADEVIGKVIYYTFSEEDSLAEVARRFDVGIQAVMDANKDKKNSKAFKPGARVILPAAHVLPPVRHEGIVINLSEPRLYLFTMAAPPKSFPVSIGKAGWETPVGETSVVKKRPNPTWVPTDALRAEDPTLPLSVPPGPDNPLGAFALNLGWPGFAIHGTNMPETIGRRASHGCIRMYPEDILTLFNAVEPGTRVTVIDAPYKLGWKSRTLFLEIPAPRRQGKHAGNVFPSISEINKAIREKAGAARIEWEAVDRALKLRDGVPVAVAGRDAGASTAILPMLAIQTNDTGGGRND